MLEKLAVRHESTTVVKLFDAATTLDFLTGRRALPSTTG